MRIRIYAAIGVALLFAAACAPMSTGVDRSRDATLVVENRSVSEMNIYLLRSSSERIRLGTARGLATTSLRIRGDLVNGGPLRFIADPIGGNRLPVSDDIVVQPGDEVMMIIPP